MARNDWKIDGMKELERSFKKLGKVPQPAATKGARAGGQIALKAAKAMAPHDTEALREGIILKGERTTIKGKKVYEIVMDSAKNHIFVKITKDGKRYYYPASQEYGFLTVDGGYVPGFHFLRNAIDMNADAIYKRVLEVAGREVDKALKKGR